MKAWREAHWPNVIPQALAAKQLGVSQGHLSCLEAGTRRFTEARRLAVFTRLQVPLHLRTDVDWR